MITLIIILGLAVVILGYTTFNLLRKNEKQEDILTGYMSYLNKISETIEMSDKKLKEVDIKGSFKSDDEIGFFFQQIQSIQTILNSFIIKNVENYETQYTKYNLDNEVKHLNYEKEFNVILNHFTLNLIEKTDLMLS